MPYPNMAGPTATLNVYGLGAGTEIPLLSATITVNDGEPATMTCVIDNASGDFGPTCDLFDCTTLNESYVPQRWFQLEILGGWTGVPWLSQHWLQEDHQAVEDANDATVTVEFVDRSDALFTADQMMDDIESTSEGSVMAKTVLAEILEEYGITRYDFSGYTDHPIAILHRVGTPMDWIREIIDRRQGWWYFEEDIFILKDGGDWTTSAAVDLDLTGHEHLTVLNYRRSKQAVFNSAVCQRVDASSGIALQTAGAGRGTMGPFDLDFPVTSATASFWAPQAGLPPYNLVWYDAEDNILSTNATYTGSVAATKFEFVLEPPIPDTDPTFQVPFELYIRGQRENSNATITSNYTATYVDTADQAVNGKRPLRAPIVAPTVLDQDDAEDYVERVVRESVNSYAQAEIETILDATVTPRITVRLNVARSRLVNHKMQVTGYTFNLNLDGNNPSATMQISLQRSRV